MISNDWILVYNKFERKIFCHVEYDFKHRRHCMYVMQSGCVLNTDDLEFLPFFPDIRARRRFDNLVIVFNFDICML